MSEKRNPSKREPKSYDKANIVGKTYKEIMHADTDKHPDCEVAQQNELINPDPHSLGSRG